MSLRKRKKQKAKSVLPVLINPGPAPVAVNPFESANEAIQNLAEATKPAAKTIMTFAGKVNEIAMKPLINAGVDTTGQLKNKFAK